MNAQLKVLAHHDIDVAALAVDSLVVFITEGKERPQELEALDNALGGELSALFAEGEATGKANEVVHVRTNGRIAAKHVYLTGLGKADKLDGEAVRKAAGTVVRKARGTSAAVVVPADEHARATAEGLLLGSYTYNGQKTDVQDDKKLSEFTLVASGDAAAEVEIARIQAEAVNAVRDLTNLPGNLLDPVVFADRAAEKAKALGLDVEVLDEKQLQEQGMNLLYSVGKGSEIPPRLVTIRYNGAPDSKDVLALVGKGVTYDTGGYIIKPETAFEGMHTDMMGAACVLGAMEAIANRKLALNVIAVLVLAENMISDRAFKPGDVVTAFNGKTVEMIDTDCEGRLVLADGVAYAKSLGATRIVDTATLTGAVTIVLGKTAGSLFGNDDSFVELVRASGAAVGEKLHALPNFPEFDELIESKVADYINYSGRTAAAVAGGKFIAAFADDVPFVHIDMANMSVAKSSAGYTIAGATGFSTRTLIEVAERLAQ